MLSRRVDADTALPAIDMAYLAMLAEHLGAEGVAELLADGLIEVEDRLERIGLAAARGDGASVASLAHDLTGAAGHLGLAALSAEAAHLSERARLLGDRASAMALEVLAGAAIAAGREGLAALEAAIGGPGAARRSAGFRRAAAGDPRDVTAPVSEDGFTSPDGSD